MRLNPFRRPPVAAEPVDPILCLPSASIELAEGAQPLEWEIARPGTFNAFRGGRVTLTAEDLAAIAEHYDPQHLAAAVNRDHESFGPSLGWVESLRFDGQRLVARVRDLAADLVQDIRAKRYQRVSPELTPEELADGRQVYYLRGLGVLGNRDPAIRGMRPIAAGAQSAVLVHLSAADDPPAAPEDSPASTPTEEADPQATPGEEPEPQRADEPEPTDDEGDPMTQQTQGTPGDTTTGTDDTARNQQTRSADDASTQLAAARDTRAAAERELERLRDLRLAAQRERAEHRVEVDLAALGGRVSPAMTRRGLRAVMVELAAAAADDEPTTLQLAGADGTTTEVALYDALHQALAAAPDTLTALASEMAGEDPEAPTVDPRDPATRKVHLAAGLTDDRVTELAAKYGEDAIFGGPRSN